jgi:hypothetical protein
MADVLVGPIWFAVNLAMLWAAWGVVRHCFPGDTPAQCAAHVVVVMWAALVLTCHALGAVGALAPPWMGLCGLALAGMATTWLARQPPPTVPCATSGSGRREARSWHEKAIILGWSGLGAAIGVRAIERGLLQFPGDYDSLMYHIPLIDQWLQRGSLYAPAEAVWYNPGNAELAGLWLVAPFSGDFWVGLANVPVALLLVLKTLELGRQLGVPPALGHAAAVAVLASRVFLKQVATNENDLAVAGLFVAGVAYGVRHVRTRRRADSALAAVALGLLAGVKYYALGYAAVAWLGLLALTLRRRGRGDMARLAAAGAVATIALAGYWYGRNLLLTGTPVYPLGISEQAEGPRPGTLYSSLLGNGRIELLPQWVVAVWNLAGPCQAASVLALPFSLAWLLGGKPGVPGERGAEEDEAGLRWLLALLLAGCLFVFGITPFTVNPASGNTEIFRYLSIRFSQCPLVLSVLALGLTSAGVARRLAGASMPKARLPKLLAPAMTGAFAGLAAAQLVLRLGEVLGEAPLLVLLVAADLVAFGLLVRWVLGRYSRRRVAAAGLLAGLIAASAASGYLGREWHRDFATHYDKTFRTSIFSHINESVGDDSALAVLDYRYYPFFGSRRQFRPHRPRKVRSESALLSYLAAHRLGVVAAAREDRGRSRWYHGPILYIQSNHKCFENFKYFGSYILCNVNTECLSPR